MAELHYCHQLALHERLLTLPAMVVVVLSLIWRQVDKVSELDRPVRSEGFL
jgi:hypothetical protein